MMGVKFNSEERVGTVAVAVADAFAEFQRLVDELKNWQSGAEKIMHTAVKAADLAQRATGLENVCGAPDVPEAVKDLPIKYVWRVKRSTKSPDPKWLRAHNAWMSLLACQVSLAEYMKTQDPTSAEHDAAEQLHAEIEEVREPLAPYIVPPSDPLAIEKGGFRHMMTARKKTVV